jgi:hypothetical protein
VRRLLRHVWGAVLHVRAGYSPRTYGNADCGCEFAVPRQLWAK